MTVEGRLKLGVRSEWIEVGCDERSSSRIGALVCSVVALGRRLACVSGERVGAGMRARSVVVPSADVRLGQGEVDLKGRVDES